VLHLHGVGCCLLLLLLSLIGQRDEALEAIEECLNYSKQNIRSHPLEKTRCEDTYSPFVSAPADYLPLSSVDSDSKMEATGQLKIQY